MLVSSATIHFVIDSSGTASWDYFVTDNWDSISSFTGTDNGVTNPTYAYDGNGNMTSGAGRTVTLSSFNMALSIVQGTTTTTLRYDPEHYRIDRTDTVGGVSTSMAYIGDPVSGALAEFYNDGGLHWHDYLQVDGHYVAEHFCDGFPTCTSAGTWKYFVTDNLGSVASIMDASGTVVERDSYDPWGRPRVYASGADDSACGSTPTPVSKRGYTGHERIDSECLVNANARIYDPTVGRFMSPDRFVSDRTDLQDWNPYSYVDNRPLTLTDPTGHEGCNASLCGTGTSATNYQAMNAAQLSSDVSSVTVYESDGSEPAGMQFGMTPSDHSAGTTGFVDKKGHLIPGTAKLAAAVGARLGLADGTSGTTIQWMSGWLGGAKVPDNFKDSYNEVFQHGQEALRLGQTPLGWKTFKENWQRNGP